MKLWICGVAILVGGCVEVGVRHCDDGSVCPAGTKCGDPSGCVSPGDCGDGVLNGDEVCDDGNTRPNDGCAANCLSLETCGNSVVDMSTGEECDDGDLRSHDGCSSGCLVEVPVWTQSNASGPSKRTFAAMAWDPDHGRGVLHGGGDVVANPPEHHGDTWFLTRGVWTKGPDGPGPLSGASLATDGRGAMVMIGGDDSTGCGPSQCVGCLQLEDSGWKSCTPLPAHGRTQAAMSEAPGQTMFLFGGVGAIVTGPYVWDQGTWMVQTSTQFPRRGPAAVWDPFDRKTYIVGGAASASNETLVWDGVTLTTLGTAMARASGVVVFDPVRRTMVAFGGQDTPGGGGTPQITLEARGASAWLDIGASPGPSGRFGNAGFYDPIVHGFMTFGGQSQTTVSVTNDDLWILRWESATPDDACDGADADRDGKIGCDDEDCWARCTPRCPPGATCPPDQPHCGDGVCNPDLEDAALCPSDC